MAKIDIGLVITAFNRASPGINSANTSLNNLGKTARNTEQRLRAIHVVLTGIGATIATSLARSFVDAASKMQGLQIRLASAVGGFERARDVFNDLSGRFESAPIEIAAITDGFTKLVAAGLDIEKTTQLTNSLVNAVAAFGGDTNVFNRAIIGFSQVIGKGTLQMEELRQQIGEAVPIAMRLMADEAGVSVGEFIDRVGKGMVTGEEAVRLFTEGATKRFQNFGELLGFTLGGAMQRVNSIFQRELTNLLERTSIDERLVVIFRNVGDALAEFMQNIDEAAVDRFFAALESVYDALNNVLTAMWPVIEAIGTMSLVVIETISNIPPEVLQLGIAGFLVFGGAGTKVVGMIIAGLVAIGTATEDFGTTISNFMQSISLALPLGALGLFVFGPKGAVIATLIAAAVNELIRYVAEIFSWLVSWIDSESAAAIQRFADNGAALGVLDEAMRSLSESSATAKVNMDGLRGSVDGFEGEGAHRLFGSPEDIANVTNQLTQIDTLAKNMPALPPPTAFDKGLEQATKRAERLREKMSDVIRTVSDDIAKISMELVGDELGLAVAQVNEQFGDMRDKLEDAIVQAVKLNETTGKEGETIQMLNALLEQSNLLRDQAIAKEEKLFGIKREQFLIEQDAQRAQVDRDILDLQRRQNTSPGFNLLANTAGGQITLQVERERFDLSQQVLDLDRQILGLQLEKLNTHDPAMRASIEATMSKLQQLRETSIGAMSGLNENAILQQQLWQQVGDIISQGVGDAIVGLIDGTKTLEDVGRQVWQALTRAAVDYLMQLIQIELMQAALGMGGGGGFGGFFADGGVFPGNVKPFANGDIIRGPTMFGLAGEAGDEAIMPLTRIGGKLGVMATGAGGGDNVSITINAIDTQTGTEFLLKNIGTIQDGMAHRRLLNRGMRTQP